jgi:hypothetical protein
MIKAACLVGVFVGTFLLSGCLIPAVIIASAAASNQDPLTISKGVNQYSFPDTDPNMVVCVKRANGSLDTMTAERLAGTKFMLDNTIQLAMLDKQGKAVWVNASEAVYKFKDGYLLDPSYAK